MNNQQFLLFIFTTFLWSEVVAGVELTFELPDNEKQCFYEYIPINTTTNLDFQVVAGGQYDIDVLLEAPNREIIYKKKRSQFDTHSFTSRVPGVYAVCFSNEFSAISHKIVYMDFQVEQEQPLTGLGENLEVMTQMESSVQEIHKCLLTIHDYQTHHRLQEAQGRKRAEELNEQVLWWSIIEIFTILVSAIGQVLIVVRDLTVEKKTTQLSNKM